MTNKYAYINKSAGMALVCMLVFAPPGPTTASDLDDRMLAELQFYATYKPTALDGFIRQNSELISDRIPSCLYQIAIELERNMEFGIEQCGGLESCEDYLRKRPAQIRDLASTIEQEQKWLETPSGQEALQFVESQKKSLGDGFDQMLEGIRPSMQQFTLPAYCK